MKIIDAHIHTLFEEQKNAEAAKRNNIDYSLKGLDSEMKKNNVVNAVSITLGLKNETPIDLEYMNNQVKDLPSIIPCIAINPHKIPKNAIAKIEKAIQNGQIKALKIYLGYYHVYASDKVYYPFYKIAEKYDIPVIFHTGDTLYSEAKLKYALPLSVDEIAVDFPKTKFIIAHLGNPWIEDAAEVVYKNPNVYADLSGLFIVNNPGEEELIRRIRNAFINIDNPTKLLYGTDWPLASMNKYIEFIKKCIPKEHHEKVFYLNAKAVFKI